VGRNAPHGKRLVYAAAFNGNNYTLKNLNTLAVAFYNAQVNVYGVAGLKFWPIFRELFQ
jgi:hypothetical protein